MDGWIDQSGLCYSAVNGFSKATLRANPLKWLKRMTRVGKYIKQTLHKLYYIPVIVFFPNVI